MLTFHSPTLSDQDWVRALLDKEILPLCSYNFTVLFCWKDYYHYKIAQLGQRLLVRLRSINGHAYLWPAGEGDPIPALDALKQDAAAHNEPLRLIGLTLYHKNWLEENCPGRFSIEEVRDGFDYIYAVDRLASLAGKKLHAKRNHIHRFDDNCPGWTWAPLTDNDVDDCLAMNKAWYEAALAREDEQGLRSLTDEHHALTLALTNYKTLRCEGVVIRWEGKLLSFTLASPLNAGMFDVHFEKADAGIQGNYPAINRSLALHIQATHPEVKYLNREDDMGMPGLRKAKLSYYPDYLQVNYCACEVL